MRWLVIILAALAAACGPTHEVVRFRLVDVDPAPLEGLAKVRMIVAVGSESVSRDFDVPADGRPRLELTFEPAEVSSVTLLGYDSDGNFVGEGRATAEQINSGAEVVPMLFVRFGKFQAFNAGDGQWSGHTATALLDGRLLVVSESSAEVLDSLTGTTTPVGPPEVTHGGHGALRLTDGRVLIVGGGTGEGVEVFDPSSDTFSRLDDLNRARPARPALLELGGGQVLVAGGIPDPAVTSPAEIVDVDAGTVSDASLDFENREGAGVVTTAGGTIVIAGGEQSSVSLTLIEGSDGAGASPASDDLNEARTRPTLAEVPARNQVLVIGGYATPTGNGVVDVVERIHSTTFAHDTFGALPALAVAEPATTVLSGGGDTIVVAGGSSGGQPTDAVQFVTWPAGGSPALDISTTAPNAQAAGIGDALLQSARTGAQAVRLATGDIVVVGGSGAGGGDVPLYEILRPVPD